jgi:lysophospholipase L1-like esterase
MKLNAGKKALFAGITVLIALLISVSVLELIIRIIFFQPRGRAAVSHEFKLSDLEGVPYELTPDHTYEWVYGRRSFFDKGFSIPVRTNSHGYRGQDLIEPVPKGVYRILALGDSFTLGLGVHEEDIWVSQLEHLLNVRKTSVLRRNYDQIEIINTGVGSWNTIVQYHFLRQKGLRHHPDAVILGFFVNDYHVGDGHFAIDDNGFLVTTQGGDTRLQLQALLYEKETKRNLVRRLIDSSHLIRWASGRNMIFQERQLMATYNRKDKNRVFDAVCGIHALTRSADIPFYVCMFPHVQNTVPSHDQEALDEMAELCRSLEIPFLRMEDALKNIEAESVWVHPRDHHPDATAHALYANHIFTGFFCDGT